MTKTSIFNAVAATILVGGLVLGGSAMAMHHGDDRGKDGRPERMERMIEALELNKEQTEAFKAMHRDRDEHKEDRMARIDLHEAMHALGKEDTLDEKKMNALGDKIAAQAKQEAVKRTRAFHNFYSGLNAEQRTKFDDMHGAMKEHRAERMARFEERMDANEERHDGHHDKQGDAHHEEHHH